MNDFFIGQNVLKFVRRRGIKMRLYGCSFYWCFTPLSTLFQLYHDDASVCRKGLTFIQYFCAYFTRYLCLDRAGHVYK